MAGPCDDPLFAAANPAACFIGQQASNAVSAVAQSGFDRLLAELAGAMVRTTNLLMTFWMKVPSANPLTTPYTTGGRPTPLPATPQLTDAIATARGSMVALVAVIGFFGIVIAAARAGLSNRSGDLVPIPKMLFNLIAVSMFGVVAVWVGIQATDAYANWILERAQPGFGASPSPGLIKEQWIIQAGLVTGGLQVLVGVLASLAQILFMFFRGALLLLLLVVWPTVAAGTATEAGLSAFKKLNAWIIALLLYKPIAATVYAVGFLVYAKTDVAQGFGGQVMSLLLGTTILVLAAIALPMLVRFVMPPAGIGASSAFSGGAALAGVATGAVAVAGLAVGGAGLAASGAGSAASGSRAASMGSGGGAGRPDGGRPAGGGPAPQPDASSGTGESPMVGGSGHGSGASQAKGSRSHESFVSAETGGAVGGPTGSSGQTPSGGSSEASTAEPNAASSRGPNGSRATASASSPGASTTSGATSGVTATSGGTARGALSGSGSAATSSAGSFPTGGTSSGSGPTSGVGVSPPPPGAGEPSGSGAAPSVGGTASAAPASPSSTPPAASGSGASRPPDRGAPASPADSGSQRPRDWRPVGDAIPSDRDQNDVWEGQ